ncbi:MAG TPA: YqgE/AlgH family protein [Stellaceae bacterium]|nr:YqgE/AlgH family protein [Stellaceae bacterium]
MAKFGIGRAAALAMGLFAGVLGLAAIDPTPAIPDKPSAGDSAPADPPAGILLIASAQIQDPRFYHAVILVLRHDRGGAFGIVVNHPLTSETVASLLAATGDDDQTVEGTIPVHSGGPVQPELGFVVHSADYRRADTLAVDGNLAMTASKDALKDIGHHRGPKQFFFAFGYAGWGAGQLEGEIERKDWFTLPEDPALVFDEDSSKVWDRALARRQQEL